MTPPAPEGEKKNPETEPGGERTEESQGANKSSGGTVRSDLGLADKAQAVQLASLMIF